jgi:hypothetical protein
LEHTLHRIDLLSEKKLKVYLWSGCYDGKHYMINIQQAANQLIVLPQDFYIREPNKALVSFGKNGDNNNNKRVSTALEIQKPKEILSKITLMVSSYMQMSFMQRSP